MQVEVRIPTYQRPELLSRALESLMGQSYSNWRAFIFDDSPSFESRSIVDRFRDRRIQTSKNSKQLGAAGNIDQCFSRGSFSNSDFAFVLEDDNAIKDGFIESNLDFISSQRASILLRNQAIFQQSESNWIETSETTKAGIFFDDGLYDAIYVRSLVFFDECVANGGLFWNLKTTISDLCVGSLVTDSGLQEFCRTLKIAEDIAYVSEPLGIWTRMPENLIRTSRVSNRIFGRALQSIQLHLLRVYGPDLISYLNQVSKTHGLEEILTKTLLNLGSPLVSLSEFFKNPKTSLLLKGFAKRATTKSVLHPFLSQLDLTLPHSSSFSYNQ